jgi:arylsulfatase A-like enzyme
MKTNILLAALALSFAMRPASFAAPARPNIIVILTDDLGYADLGCQGGVKDVKTPHIDALAAAGVRCTAGYITAPQCSPSRAGLITGRYQARFGLEEIALCPLPQEEVTIAERLKPAGYRSGFAGKWHLDVNVLCEDWLKKNVPDLKPARRGYQVPPGVAEKFSPHAQGFDDYYDGELKRYRANYTLDGKAEPQPRLVSDDRFRVDVQSDAAVAFIGKNKATPFYLHLCYYAPHVPLEATAKYLDRFPGDMPVRRRYALAMLSAIDDGVGRIVARLKENGLDQNTLIFFTSDNGAPLKGMKDVPINNPGGAWDGSLNDPLNGEKGQLLEGGIRVPFIVTWPAGLPGGKTYDRPVSSLDIAATANAVAGLPNDPKLDGVNILPHLRGEVKSDAHSALYWRFWSQTAVRSGDWKLVRQSGNTESLFNLADDISEKHDQLSRHPDKAKELREMLTKWESQMVPPKPRAVRKE